MDQVYSKFGLEAGTKDFIGHAMALFLDDAYLHKPAREAYERILLYVNSMARYGKSPYIYPLYGLGELPQGFARYLSKFLFNIDCLQSLVERTCWTSKLMKSSMRMVLRQVFAVATKLQRPRPSLAIHPTFPAKFVVLERSFERFVYFNILFPTLTMPIPFNSSSLRIKLVDVTVLDTLSTRVNLDIYIAEVSAAHNVCAKGHYLAIVSTIVETDNPQIEIKPGLDLLGPILDK